MTMPDERTRALRWGWEFLWESQDATNLTESQQGQIKAILHHYPCGSEIKQWAMDDSMSDLFSVMLEPEDPKLLASQILPNVPDFVERGPTSPAQRTWAINEAYLLLRLGDMSWTPSQRREIKYVLRHFPSLDMSELPGWAANDEACLKADPLYKQWLAPMDAVAETVQ
jgi:hypothetical protein